MPEADGGGEDLPPHDTVGCLYAIARLGCFMSLLQALMFLAIIAAAIVSLLFFR
ncbi:MAG TPA: hypothetical protein VK929_16920 [Longimicrobiales bacterium]|nr:hypothetical protein [Longimicrobiales bacterium]